MQAGDRPGYRRGFQRPERENLGDLLVVCDLRMKIKDDSPPFVYHEMFKPHSPEA